ncbi:hypothetical protein LCM23_13315 [Cytobacillus kochii]|uniref:hypothetical protein n=1 Tax=Cytobacillus kochii TaxID=859143 RepID=UPI001CD48654|nr:hypothetical protein [Cytobacillus kochii]MCA1027075.1 hypothetical protein [Cytobacillus kochii]
MNDLREKFINKGIPYDNIDKEMIEVIDVLNFQLGLKTKYCCYGHRGQDFTHIVFHESVDDEKIYRLGEIICKQWLPNFVSLKKWIRFTEKFQPNWVLEIGVRYKDPNSPEKRERFERIVNELKRIDRSALETE